VPSERSAAMAKRTRKRPPRSSLALRWLAVGALVLVGLLYYRPVRAYLDRSNTVAARQAQVDALAQRHAALERRLRYVGSQAAVAREARRLGYVKPGERLFIVKGIPAWRAAKRAGATIAPSGR
jgi:cell division protein FtsB